MEIFEFALSFEEEHEKFYRRQLEETNDSSLQEVFRFLADEESKHQVVVQKLLDERPAEDVSSDLIPEVKELFTELSSDLPESVKETTQVDIYKQGREMEERAYKFYKEKAEETDSVELERILKDLAGEEEKHWAIMNNLVELVNRPNTWLDDAEWYHREDY